MDCALECPICTLSLLPAHVTETHDQDNAEMSLPDYRDNTESDRRRDRSRSASRLQPVCTPCGHLFHKACIQEWFRIRRNYDPGSSMCTCPSCRRTISYHKLIRVYLPTSSSDNWSNDNIPTRDDISLAVRRYNEQHMEALSADPARRLYVPRIYNEFFSCFNGFSRSSTRRREDDDFNGSGALRRYLRDSLSDESSLDSPCDNEECVALQNVYRVLSVEFKHQKRRLEQEIDISKMKSILVTGLQREVDHLRKMNARNTSFGEKFFWSICSAIIFVWLSVIAGMVIF